MSNATAAPKLKVDGILPLTFLQNALLFHSLSSLEDQGFIHVKINLKGKLNTEKLKQCWELLMRRHDVFRSSIHWEKIKTPVQVIHKTAHLDWQLIDLSAESEENQAASIERLLEKDRKEGFNLNKAAISRISLIRLAEESHLMVWACHHLLLDGWSSANAIRDLAALYDMEDPSIMHLPSIPTLVEYKRDAKNNNSALAKSYWETSLSDLKEPTLLSDVAKSSIDQSSFIHEKYDLGHTDFEQLELFAKSQKSTLTTLLQMAWTMVVSRVCERQDVIFGNIVSVRSSRLKNTDKMCGLFTNMLPVRIKVDPEITLLQFADSVQQNQLEARDFSYASLDDIQRWIDWPGYISLFDHIFVVENFPMKDIVLDELTFEGFRSGITSSYPLTVVVTATNHFSLHLIYDASKISKELINYLGENILKLLKDMSVGKAEVEVDTLVSALPPFTGIRNASPKTPDFTAPIDQPRTPMELMLTKIWEDLFLRDNIGTKDNFFEIGGKSLLAVRLFQKINEEFDIHLPPIMILQYPTIEKLAAYINRDQIEQDWKSLVPLKLEGSRNPVFCLHAKGGHVFFYNKLATHLDKDQPVYAIQPRGLNGKDPLYQSVEEMASHYIQEIKTVQPTGPYSILATCFSNAVGLEMAQQLRKNGEEVGMLAMIDASPGKSFGQALKEKNVLQQVNIKLKTSKLYTGSKRIYQKILNHDLQEAKEESFAIQHEKYLGKLFDQYERKPYPDRIKLFRSSEFVEMSRKDNHVEDWLDLVAKENLEIITVEAHHKTMFVEPEVQNLAAVLNQHLPKNQNASE